MDEKDMHESELNAAQPARRPKKKKRGRAGKVIRKTVKIVVVLVLAVGAGLTLTLAVDELDILSVQPGQRVALSVDALPDAALTGVVQKVAPLGDTSSGVTTYDVTVTVSGEDERVKGGMNVSGEIIVNAEDDAILIPTDALQKDGAGYCVTLESGETRRVTLGVMTDETTQILDGIGVGETVIWCFIKAFRHACKEGGINKAPLFEGADRGR